MPSPSVRVPLLLVALALPLACGPAAAPAPQPDAEPAAEVDEDVLADFATWRGERDASLRRGDSWLSLIGLFWLDEGEVTMGSGADHPLALPATLPADVGTFRRRGEAVSFTPVAGIDVAADGEPLAGERQLVADTEGDPTVLTHASLTFYLVRRGDRIGIRVKDSASPTLTGFTGIETFDFDPAWRIEARLEPHDPPRTLAVPNVLGDVTEQPTPGTLWFEAGGERRSLIPVGEAGESLFIVFGDATNGHESYGGGRFLTAEPPDAEGRVVLDFNRAYNPPCVFTPHATCPLPARENRLALRVEAGEKVYGQPDH